MKKQQERQKQMQFKGVNRSEIVEAPRGRQGMGTLFIHSCKLRLETAAVADQRAERGRTGNGVTFLLIQFCVDRPSSIYVSCTMCHKGES